MHLYIYACMHAFDHEFVGCVLVRRGVSLKKKTYTPCHRPARGGRKHPPQKKRPQKGHTHPTSRPQSHLPQKRPYSPPPQKAKKGHKKAKKNQENTTHRAIDQHVGDIHPPREGRHALGQRQGGQGAGVLVWCVGRGVWVWAFLWVRGWVGGASESETTCTCIHIHTCTPPKAGAPIVLLPPPPPSDDRLEEEEEGPPV